VDLEIGPSEICTRGYVDRCGRREVGSPWKVGGAKGFFRRPIGGLQFDFPLLDISPIVGAGKP
jgi:hypothetical protein